MEAITALLAALSTLAWPLIALAALWRYSAQIGRLLDKFSQGTEIGVRSCNDAFFSNRSDSFFINAAAIYSESY